MRPLRIARISAQELKIVWDDEHETVFSTEYLRAHCPCAVCQQQREENSRQGLFTLPLANQTSLRSIELSGHNAMIIAWGDGHNTGIYTWDYLRKIEPR